MSCIKSTCSYCNGSGRDNGEKCSNCGGSGKVREHNYEYVRTIEKSSGGGLFGLGAIHWYVELHRCTRCGDKIEEPTPGNSII